MRKCRETLRSDPFEEVDIGHIAHGLINASAELGHTSPFERSGRFLHKTNLVAASSVRALRIGLHGCAEIVTGRTR